MTDSARRRAILDLIRLRGDLDEARRVIASNSATLDDPPVLTIADIRRAIDLFLSGDLPGNALEQWAEAVHGLEEVEYDESDRANIADAVFELSTPELFGGIETAVRDLDRRMQARPEPPKA